jgi:DNA-binding XRE family transcriptional regulator
MRNHSFNTPLKLWFKASRYSDKTLGEKIKRARLERDLYQDELAVQLGVNEMTIVNWELDRTKPIKMHRSRIKKFLGIKV